MERSELINTVYFDRVFRYTASELSTAMRDAMVGTKYDTIVGTGLSGTIFAAKVHSALRKKLAIVRKPKDGAHSCNPVEGAIGKKWVFVDDFISSGATFKRVAERMFEQFPKAEFVGYYSYESDSFTSAKEMYHTYKWLKELQLGPLVWGPETEEADRERYYYDDQVRTCPVGGWSREVIARIDVPDDVQRSWDDGDGRPTFYSQKLGAYFSWDTSEKIRPYIRAEIERREEKHRQMVRKMAERRAALANRGKPSVASDWRTIGYVSEDWTRRGLKQV